MNHPLRVTWVLHGGVYHENVQRLSDRRVATFFTLVLLSGFCISLVAYRSARGYGNSYDFLAWNLLLAWIPFLLAVALHDSDRRDRPAAALLTLGAAWLVFLPNAPYIVTDFIHIGTFRGAPLWYDAGMTAAFAGTGLVLGLASVLLVQGVVARRLGAPAGWAMLAPVFLLCSAGIYIGRIHRFNSWDVIARPQRLLELVASRLADPLGRPEMLVGLAGLAGFLTIAYLVLYTISDLGPEHRERR
jgi:uncharacterized membrane protein